MGKILRDEPRMDNFNGYQARSLNIEKRRRELIKITQENHAMLQRIMARKPAYPRYNWQDFWTVRISQVCLTMQNSKEQDCIPVGRVPPARWPYLPACSVLGRGAWSRGGAWSGRGVPSPGGMGAWSGGVSQHALRQTPPPVNRMTNRCKNITLLQTSFAGGKYNYTRFFSCQPTS